MLVFCVAEAGMKLPVGIPKNVLLTYYALAKVDKPLANIKAEHGWTTLFLDCGAFAAGRAGEQIDIDRYCEYVEQNRGAIDMYCALDVWGNLQKTVENYRYMVDNWKMRPMPVFPVLSGDKDEIPRLREFAADTDYMALGNLVGRRWPDPVVREHLDRIFATLLDVNPTIKVHLFGYTHRWALLRYPLFSFDTARWTTETGSWKYHYLDPGKGRISNIPLRNAPRLLKRVPVSREVRQSDRKERLAHTANALMDYGAWLTRMWAAKGVLWQEPLHRRVYPDLMKTLEARHGTKAGAGGS